MPETQIQQDAQTPVQTPPQAPSQTLDPAEQILRSTKGVDDSIRADAWDAYHNSANEDELAGKLQNMNLPQDAKANLWDAKHSARPVVAPGTPDFSVKQALTGPNTVGGIIQSQDAGSATGTRFEGVAKLGHAITEAYHNAGEDFAHHIMPGSPVEALIQKINPSFKATAPVAYADATMRNSMNMPFASNPLAPTPSKTDITNAPVVDVAQFIDKKKNPVSKALAEAAQSFTSPTNIAILASTGGFGLVESPTALATANRLLSAGFTAQAIGAAYENSQSFKKAYDTGNASEALYQLTHLVTSGATAVMAGAHATGHELPLATPTDIAVAGKVGDVAKAAASKVGDTASVVKERLGDVAIKKGIIKPEAEAAAIQAIKPSPKAVEKFKNDWNTAAHDIQDYDKTSKIETVGDLHEALPDMKEKIWNDEIEPAVARHADETVDMSPVKKAVLDSLTPSMRKLEPEAVADVEKFAERIGAASTVSEAEGDLTYINGKLDSYFAKNPAAKSANLIANPDTAMWETARRGIREQFLQTLEAAGETGIRDARQRYGALSGLQNSVESAAGRLARTPYGSGALNRTALAEVIGGGMLGGVGALVGGPILGAAGGAAGALAAAAELLRKHNMNPDVLLRKAIESTEGAPQAAPAPNSGGTPTGGTPTPAGGAQNPNGGAEPTAQAPKKVETVPAADQALNEAHPSAKAYHEGNYTDAFQEGIRNHQAGEEPEVEVVEPTLHNNASGESAASSEAISRTAGQKARGEQMVRINTANHTETPIPRGVDSVDVKAGPYDEIVMRDKNGNETVLDRGEKAKVRRPKKTS
jgi:hypothetical protein